MIWCWQFSQFGKFGINSIPLTPFEGLLLLQALPLKEKELQVRKAGYRALQKLRVLLITATTLFGLAKRKEIAAAWAGIYLYRLLVILHKAPGRMRFTWQTNFWNTQNINKYSKCPVWALQTKKLKYVIFIAPSSLALESSDKSASSNVLYSRAVIVGASPVASSACLHTQIALVLQCRFAIAMLLCQPLNLFSLQWTNVPVLQYERNPSQNVCIVTFFFLLSDCCLIRSAVSAASIWYVYPVIQSVR